MHSSDTSVCICRHNREASSTLHYTTLHYTTLHYTTLHYTTLHYTTLHYTTLHYSTVHYTTLHYTTLQYSTVQYSTVQYSTLHYSTIQYSTGMYIYSYSSHHMCGNSVCTTVYMHILPRCVEIQEVHECTHVQVCRNGVPKYPEVPVREVVLLNRVGGEGGG